MGTVQRYWVSWYSGNYDDEGCSAQPFEFLVSGYRGRNDDSGRDDCTLCAVIEAEDEADIWKLISEHFPDYEQRFIDPRESDWLPANRFPNAKAYTLIG